MATQIQKNTKTLMEKRLNMLYAMQQQMNGNAGGEPKMGGGGNFGNPQLPYENRNLLWPQGGQQALGTIANNYNPGIWGGAYPNVNITGNYPYYNPGDANVTFNKQTLAPSNQTYSPLNYSGKINQSNFGLNPDSRINRPNYNYNSTNNNNTVQTNEVPDYSTPEQVGFGNGTPQQNTPGGIKNDPYGLVPMPAAMLDTSSQMYKAPDVMPEQPYMAPKMAIQPIGPKSGLLDSGLAKGPATATAAASSSIPWGQVGAFAGQMAPMIYNLAKGLQKPDKVKPNYNPYEGQIRSLMANRRYNIDPQLTLNRTAQAVSNRNINNVGNSRGERMANYGASQNYRMAGDAAAWSQKNNMDNQYMAEQAQMDANLGGARANMDWNVQTGDAQNKAATNQFLGQGFNDMGRFAQTQQLMSNQQKNDTNLARIYQEQFGGIVQYQKEIQRLLKEHGVQQPKIK